MSERPSEAEENEWKETCRGRYSKLADILLHNIPPEACDTEFLVEMIRGGRFTRLSRFMASLEGQIRDFYDTYGPLKKPTDSHPDPVEMELYRETVRMRDAIKANYNPNTHPSL